MLGRMTLTLRVQGSIDEQEVDHPVYYNQGSIEVIDFILDQAHLGFCRQTAIKYICRSGKKDGSSKERDLLKAIWYLQREIRGTIGLGSTSTVYYSADLDNLASPTQKE